MITAKQLIVSTIKNYQKQIVIAKKSVNKSKSDEWCDGYADALKDVFERIEYYYNIDYTK